MDSTVALDDDFELAVRAWLAARGQRRFHVVDEHGASRTSGEFSLADLGVAHLDSEPRRLITLCPSNAELVGTLGCFERVVATENSSDFPPEVAQTERLGPDLAPNLDRVAALAPDLVLSSLTVPGMERVVTGLARRGVPQIVLAARCLADVGDEAVRVAKWLGVATTGERVRRDFGADVEALAQAAADKPSVRVYLEWWPGPMFTPGRDCYSNELIALAGGVNVFGDRSGASLEIRTDELVAARPDVCFVSWCGVPYAKLNPERLLQRAGVSLLPAIAEGRVYRLDEAFAGRPGPRCLTAAREMAVAIDRWRSGA